MTTRVPLFFYILYKFNILNQTYTFFLPIWTLIFLCTIRPISIIISIICSPLVSITILLYINNINKIKFTIKINLNDF